MNRVYFKTCKSQKVDCKSAFILQIFIKRKERQYHLYLKFEIKDRIYCVVVTDIRCNVATLLLSRLKAILN